MSSEKHSENDTKCGELVVKSYGAWGSGVLKAFSQLATCLAICGNACKSKVLADLYGQLCHSLFGVNAHAILTCSYPHSVQHFMCSYL